VIYSEVALTAFIPKAMGWTPPLITASQCARLKAFVICLMVKEKNKLEIAAGKLISAIQKEWNTELGEPEAEISEEIMNKGHDLLEGAKNNNLEGLLKGMSVTQFLGDLWVHKHQGVKESILNLEAAMNEVKGI